MLAPWNEEGRLLAAVRGGDRSAAEELVERTYSAVYASLYRLCGEGAKRGWRIFLLGGPPGVAEQAATRLRSLHPGIVIAGAAHGFFGPEEEAPVLGAIRAAAPTLLLAGLGSPRQERWLDRHDMQSRVEADMILHATRTSLAAHAALLESGEGDRISGTMTALERARAAEDHVAIRDAVDALSRETEPFARRIMDRSLQEALANRRLEEL